MNQVYEVTCPTSDKCLGILCLLQFMLGNLAPQEEPFTKVGGGHFPDPLVSCALHGMTAICNIEPFLSFHMRMEYVLLLLLFKKKTPSFQIWVLLNKKRTTVSQSPCTLSINFPLLTTNMSKQKEQQIEIVIGECNCKPP